MKTTIYNLLSQLTKQWKLSKVKVIKIKNYIMNLYREMARNSWMNVIGNWRFGELCWKFPLLSDFYIIVQIMSDFVMSWESQFCFDDLDQTEKDTLIKFIQSIKQAINTDNVNSKKEESETSFDI